VIATQLEEYDMYNDILIPTDGSQGAEAALEHVIEIASK